MNSNLEDYLPFLQFIFPDGMLHYFSIVKFVEEKEKVKLYFEEQNLPPEEYIGDKLESKGFYEEVRMHDYPLRGRSCVLYIKKRRWYNHTQGKYVHRNWELVAKGTQISTEFAAFLKGMLRLRAYQCE